MSENSFYNQKEIDRGNWVEGEIRSLLKRIEKEVEQKFLSAEIPKKVNMKTNVSRGQDFVCIGSIKNSKIADRILVPDKKIYISINIDNYSYRDYHICNVYNMVKTGIEKLGHKAYTPIHKKNNIIHVIIDYFNQKTDMIENYIYLDEVYDFINQTNVKGKCLFGDQDELTAEEQIFQKKFEEDFMWHFGIEKKRKYIFKIYCSRRKQNANYPFNYSVDNIRIKNNKCLMFAIEFIIQRTKEINKDFVFSHGSRQIVYQHGDKKKYSHFLETE